MATLQPDSVVILYVVILQKSGHITVSNNQVSLIKPASVSVLPYVCPYICTYIRLYGMYVRLPVRPQKVSPIRMKFEI